MDRALDTGRVSYGIRSTSRYARALRALSDTCHAAGDSADESWYGFASHALTIDSGWREVWDTALAFVQCFVQ